MRTEKLNTIPPDTQALYSQRLTADAVVIYEKQRRTIEGRRVPLNTTFEEVLTDACQEMGGENHNTFIVLDDTHEPPHVVGVANMTTTPFEETALINGFYPIAKDENLETSRLLMNDVCESAAIAGYKDVEARVAPAQRELYGALGFVATGEQTEFGTIMRRELPRISKEQ